MPVQVLMPDRNRKEEKDPLDTIIKGLNIASSVYGIKEAYDRGEGLKEDRALAKQKLELETEKQAREGTTITPKELLSFGGKYTVSGNESPGSMKFTLREMGGNRDIYLTPKVKEVDPLDREMKQARIDALKNAPSRQAPFEKLAPEQQSVVTGLSTKNANKLAIKNQIDSVMSNWDKLSDEQKIVQGRSLLKTLNSTEGADAIGSEEAKRLGGLLEYQMFNITQPGPMFGRDLNAFATQAREGSSAIGRAIEANKAIIEQMTGRKQQYSGTELPQTSTPQAPMITREQAAQELIRRQGLKTAVGKK